MQQRGHAFLAAAALTENQRRPAQARRALRFGQHRQHRRRLRDQRAARHAPVRVARDQAQVGAADADVRTGRDQRALDAHTVDERTVAAAEVAQQQLARARLEPAVLQAGRPIRQHQVVVRSAPDVQRRLAQALPARVGALPHDQHQVRFVFAREPQILGVAV